MFRGFVQSQIKTPVGTEVLLLFESLVDFQKISLQLNIVYKSDKLVSSQFINTNIFVLAGVLLNIYDVILNG